MSEFHFGGSSTKRAELFRKSDKNTSKSSSKTSSSKSKAKSSSALSVRVKAPAPPAVKIVVKPDGKKVKKRSKPAPTVLER